MTISIALALMTMQTGPYRPHQDLIDYTKVPPDSFQTIQGIEMAIGSIQSQGYPINEAGIIEALGDTRTRTAAASLMQMGFPFLKVNFKTPGTTTALQDAFTDAALHQDEAALPHLAGALVTTDKRDWVNDAVSALPKMRYRDTQVKLATTLAWVGRAEGWPIIRTAIATNDPTVISTALETIEKFDGLPNPDGGRPIDVAAELHQFAATTPDNLMTGPQGFKTPVRGHIESKAAQVEKMRQK